MQQQEHSRTVGLYTITDLVLGSRSVGFKPATFFSQSKMSQSSLNWDILNTVQGQQCHIVLPKNCSEFLDMTPTCPTKMLKIARNDPSWPEKTAQNCSKLLKIAQSCSPSIVSFNWQGSLVIRLVAIVSINGLSRKNRVAFDRKKRVMPAVSFASLLPLGDTAIRHELLGFLGFLRFER